MSSLYLFHSRNSWDCQSSVEVDLYHKAFSACAAVMGVRPLGDEKEYWYEQISDNFMYSPTDAFAAPPIATEGAHVLHPRPCRAITLAGVEIILLSSEESIASSEHGLNIPRYAFAGSLRDLFMDHDGQKPKRPSKKKIATLVGGSCRKKPEASVEASDAASYKGVARPQQLSLDDFMIVANSLEELYSIGGKFKAGGATVARSPGSVSSRDQPSGATLTSIPVENELEADPILELTRKKCLHTSVRGVKPGPCTDDQKGYFPQAGHREEG
ncbi:hypothetical protein Hdeb2414_s0493g00904901 [Helianthus debilis subsp. tardiflorus]